jgi:hypothetical protein
VLHCRSGRAAFTGRTEEMWLFRPMPPSDS